MVRATFYDDGVTGCKPAVLSAETACYSAPQLDPFTLVTRRIVVLAADPQEMGIY